MRAKTDLFKVNGKPMLAPDTEVSASYADLDSEESGRDEVGVMHRLVVQYKMGTWGFAYSSLTEEEKQYMENLFPDAPDFEFTHPSRKDATKMVTTRCYRSNYGLSWINAKTGVWKNYKFNIIACEGED